MGGATCRKTPISRSTLEKNPMPAHLVEGKPMDEGTTRRGTDTRARGGFLPRHDEDLREPLVRRQGSQVCMREVRGSLNWKGRVLTTGLPGKSLPGFSISRPLAWISLGKGRNACLNAHSRDLRDCLNQEGLGTFCFSEHRTWRCFPLA